MSYECPDSGHLRGEFGGGRDAGVAGVAGGEVREQGTGHLWRSAAGGDAGYSQGGGGGLGAKVGIEIETAGDHVEGFAGAPDLEQTIDMLFGQAGEIAGIVPGGDAPAEPAVVVGGVAAGSQPVLQRGPGLGVRAGADLSVDGGDFSIGFAQLLGALEVCLALRGGPGFEAQLVTPLVEGAAEDAEHGQDAIHEYGDLHR